MNAVPTRASSQVNDWVINYVEVNSQPSAANEFCRLRITGSEIQIDPVGIVLTIQQTHEQGLELRCGTDTYSATMSQRGNELVLELHRVNSSDSVLIVAKQSVSEYPTISFRRGASENTART